MVKKMYTQRKPKLRQRWSNVTLILDRKALVSSMEQKLHLSVLSPVHRARQPLLSKMYLDMLAAQVDPLGGFKAHNIVGCVFD